MGKVVSGIGDALGFGGDDVADASRDAAGLSAAAEREKLDYLKEREAIPQQFREGALLRLGGLAGIEGGEGTQTDLIERARTSPYYTEMISEGEDSVLRNASATGKLRSGNVREALADTSRKVLMDSYDRELSGLQGLAGLPSNATAIGESMSSIGKILGQGEIAAAQGQQDAFGNLINTGLGVGGLLASAGVFSDERLKTDIQPKGQKNGYNWYSFTWNKMAEELFDLTGDSEGVIAQEIVDIAPGAVEEKDGYLTVDYTKLGVI